MIIAGEEYTEGNVLSFNQYKAVVELDIEWLMKNTKHNPKRDYIICVLRKSIEEYQKQYINEEYLKALKTKDMELEQASFERTKDGNRIFNGDTILIYGCPMPLCNGEISFDFVEQLWKCNKCKTKIESDNKSLGSLINELRR